MFICLHARRNDGEEFENPVAEDPTFDSEDPAQGKKKKNGGKKKKKGGGESWNDKKGGKKGKKGKKGKGK